MTKIIIWSKWIGFLSLLTLVAEDSIAQVKRDIRGFYLGMPLADVRSKTTELSCRTVGDPNELREHTRPGDGRRVWAYRWDVSCGDRTSFEFLLTAGSEEKILKVITYTLRAPLDRLSLENLVASVSKEFSTRASAVALGCGAMCKVSQWNLPDQQVLNLETFYGCCNLTLRSDQLEATDGEQVRERLRRERPTQRF